MAEKKRRKWQGAHVLKLSKVMQRKRVKLKTQGYTHGLSPKEEEIANEEDRRTIMEQRRQERAERRSPAGPKGSIERRVLRRGLRHGKARRGAKVRQREVYLHATKGYKSRRLVK